MSSVNKFEAKMKNNSNETRVALLEQSLTHIADALVRMEKRFDKIDERIIKFEEKVNIKFDEMKKDIKSIDNRLWSNFLWMLSTMFTLAGLCGGMMAKGFGWFH